MAGSTFFDREDHEEVYNEFHNLVNMTALQLEQWLQTDESQRAGYRQEGQSEPTGHEYGRQVVQFLHRQRAELTNEDYHRMQKVIAHIKQRLAQNPSDYVNKTDWRYSLMNWGHDPL